MFCEPCGRKMHIGAPHSEEIKTQYECSCGNIEVENYTPEEMKFQEALARGESPDRCGNHDCPKCGYRMTDRQCLKCVDSKGRPIRVRFCAYCDGGPIVFGNCTEERYKEICEEFERVGKKLQNVEISQDTTC